MYTPRTVANLSFWFVSQSNEAVRMTNWQVLQLACNESFDHEANTIEAALVFALPIAEEWI